MPNSQPNLLTILETDQSNLEGILQQFRENGILNFFERMLDLLDDLRIETQQHESKSPFIRSADGTITFSWDLRLRIHMINSAWNQYIFAISHLLRAQVTEVYGHVRRAIEGAGIAYLSKSEPDIGELYGAGDDKKLRNRTGTNTILPLNNPLTVDLNRMVREASGQVHSNFKSFVKRMEEDIVDAGTKAHYRYKSHVYDSDDSLKHFWGASYFILESGYLVARLLAESFGLPQGSWHKQLENFKVDLEKFNNMLEDAFKKHASA